MLAPRLGARELLALQPDLLRACLAAMTVLNVCNAAAALWGALLVGLRRELQSELGGLRRLPACRLYDYFDSKAGI